MLTVAILPTPATGFSGAGPSASMPPCLEDVIGRPAGAIIPS